MQSKGKALRGYLTRYAKKKIALLRQMALFISVRNLDKLLTREPVPKPLNKQLEIFL
jgi:hypothetical protein